MVVDRTWDIWDNISNDFFPGFESADILWRTVVENLNIDINNTGISEYNKIHDHQVRLKWTTVKRFLSGEITYLQLKQELGCP